MVPVHTSDLRWNLDQGRKWSEIIILRSCSLDWNQLEQIIKDNSVLYILSRGFLLAVSWHLSANISWWFTFPVFHIKWRVFSLNMKLQITTMVARYCISILLFCIVIFCLQNCMGNTFYMGFSAFVPSSKTLLYRLFNVMSARRAGSNEFWTGFWAYWENL